MNTKGLYMRQNRKGFTAIEFIVSLAVVGMIVIAVYMFRQPKQSNTNETTNESEQTFENYNDGQEVYPTPNPLPENTGDSKLDEAAQQLNALSNDLNELDTIEDDLDLPEINLTVE